MTTPIAPSLLTPINHWKKPVFFIAIAAAVTAATAALFLSSTFAAVGYALLGLIAMVFYREDGLTQRKVQELTSQNEGALNQVNAASAIQQRILNVEIDILTQENQRLDGVHQQQVEVNAALTQANGALTQDNQRLNTVSEQQIQTSAALTQENQRLNGENQQHVQANTSLTQENATLKRENKDLTRRNQALSAENGILKTKIVQSEAIAKDKESLSTTQESIIKGYEEAITKSAAENKDLREKNEGLEAVVETMKVEINRAQELNKGLKLEIAGLNTQFHQLFQGKENSQNQQSSLPPLTRRLSAPLNPYLLRTMGSTVVNVVNTKK